MSTPTTTAKYYVDESLMGLAKTLATARRDVLFPGHRDLPDILPGAKDPKWMPRVAALGLVVIAREKRLRTCQAVAGFAREKSLLTNVAYALRLAGRLVRLP